MMDRVTNGLPFIFVWYLDDIIMGYPDLASHLQHLQLLFQRLREFGLVINGEKCEFGAKELHFQEQGDKDKVVVCRDGGHLHQHQGSPRKRRPARPPNPRSGDMPHGGRLQQRPSPSSSWQPMGFFSKKLNLTQQRYSAFDRELLACTAGIRHFRSHA
jgi:hypothetical protein